MFLRVKSVYSRLHSIPFVKGQTSILLWYYLFFKYSQKVWPLFTDTTWRTFDSIPNSYERKGIFVDGEPVNRSWNSLLHNSSPEIHPATKTKEDRSQGQKIRIEILWLESAHESTTISVSNDFNSLMMNPMNGFSLLLPLYYALFIQ